MSSSDPDDLRVSALRRLERHRSSIIRITGAAVLVCLALVAVSGQSRRAQIMVTGAFLEDGPWQAAAGQWLALRPRRGGYVVEPATVRVRKQKNPDCDRGQLDEFVVTVEGVGEQPLLLLRGFPRIVAGAVSAMQTGYTPLYPGSEVRLRSNARSRWQLRATGEALKRETSYTVFRNYALRLEGPREGRVLSIDETDDDRVPILLWAGDLDRDGVPDLITEIRPSYAIENRSLFLSSSASPGFLVSRAASLDLSGCN